MFLDTETTGLDPERHEVISIGCVETNQALEVVGKRELLVQPIRIEDADPRALEINGYDPARWGAHGTPKTLALAKVWYLLHDCVIAGHNVEFDRRFLAAEFGRYGSALPRGRDRPEAAHYGYGSAVETGMIHPCCPKCGAKTKRAGFHIRGQFCLCGWWRDENGPERHQKAMARRAEREAAACARGE